ncbi:MAG: hypothetical protein AB9834_09825 [Lentimicrobium sp.]
MIIKLANYSHFHKDNKAYNTDITPFIKELFETYTTGRINYIISIRENFLSTKRHHYFNSLEGNKQHLFPQPDIEEMNYSQYKGLGPLEFSLASYLLNSKIGYNVIVLTGALGSGKTCLCDYTLNYISTSLQDENYELFFPKDGIIHKIDFNELFDESLKDELVIEFKLLMISKLTSLIEKIHEQELFIEQFIQKVKSKENERYELFSDFVRLLNNENIRTEKGKFSFLLDWLNKYDINLSYKLRLISYLLSSIKDIKNKSNINDFIILFDNIDKLPDDAQIEILNIIFSFSVKLPIKLLIPMRLTTFGKIKGNGSYSFAVMQNTGQKPLYIFSRRIQHFIDNMTDYNLSNKISKLYHNDLLNKFSFIGSCIKDDIEQSRLLNAYSAISGNSIRRGLFLAERLFVNSVIFYSETKLYQDDFTRSLLLANNENGKFSNDDRLVNNIFSSFQNENTLLKLRILQILNYFKENEINCNISLLISQISLFEEYSSLSILNAINDLMFYPRRLIYVDGVKNYSDENNLSQSMSDHISISITGVEYLNTLVYNIVYLQSCFVVINWKVPNAFKNIDYLKLYIDKIYLYDKSNYTIYLRNLLETRKSTITDFISPEYNYTLLSDRMKLIRECLYFLMLNDLNQLAIYYENNNIHNIDAIDNRYIKNSIIIDIIGKTSLSVLGILKNNSSFNSEANYWYDLLILSDLWHQTIFKTNNKFVDLALKIFNNESFKNKKK